MKKSRQGKVLLHLNIIATLVCLAFFLFVLLYIGNPVSAAYFGLGAFAFAFNIWLVLNHHNKIASVFSIVIANLLVFVFDSGMFWEGHNSPILYVPLLLFSYVVTGYDEKLKRWLLILFSVTCIVVVNFTNLSPRLGAEFEQGSNGKVVQVVNVIIALSVSLIIVRTITRQNFNMERRMQEAKDLAEKSLKEKTRFLSIMSHEIRTPANAVVGMANVLMTKSMPDEIKRDLRVLHYSAQNLKSVIDNVIYYDKLELGKEDIVNLPFDIRKFCFSLVDSFESEAAKKELKLNFDFDDRIPQYLIGDSDKLGQIIANLLSNAIKFTRSGDIFLWVKMNHIDEKSCYLLFKLADTGVGIDEENMKVVFQAFSQMGNDITRNTDGLGLGLSIAQKLLKLLGSKIYVESEKGVGTTFHFDVQFELTTTIKDAEQRYIETHNLNGLKVLLVEDNKLNVLVAKKILTAMNAIVEVAKNGEEGVRYATNKAYDIILMDIHMPVMDGYEATRQIRKLGNMVPILAFSADAFDEARRLAVEAGMNDFISKPFDPVTLYEKIIANHTRG
jgi:signal transduction histidine kinase